MTELVVAKFHVNLAEPRLDLLGFKLDCEALHELFVLRAVRKKDFPPFNRRKGISRSPVNVFISFRPSA